MTNPYRDGDYVRINRDDALVDEFLDAGGNYDDPLNSPFYGTVQTAIDEDNVQVLCNSGELRTFKRYQLDWVDEEGDQIEFEPFDWTEDLMWLAVCISMAFVLVVVYTHV